MHSGKHIVGNIKMNLLTREERDLYIKNSLSAFDALTQEQRTSLTICPPSIYTEIFVESYKNTDVSVGAQNVHQGKGGKNTGEVSAGMLASIGVKSVIIGHSERRAQGETNEQVCHKVVSTLEAELSPIICVGYCDLGEDEESCVRGRVVEVVSSLRPSDMEHIAFAYEPVWAIGTGKTPTTDQIHSMVLTIRKAISIVHGTLSASVPVLYGGSVTHENVASICTEGHADGVLVGGASLDPVELAKMSELVS